MSEGVPNHRLRESLPAVNLVVLLSAVAVLWWRAAALEQQVEGLGAAVHALQVEVAVLHQALGRP
ncbi:MAG: hypothetical protein ACREKK_00455 [Candidatus Methylomirabilales bacterium]